MGKKNRKKTTWRKLSLQDDSASATSDERGSSTKTVDDSCNCHTSRNSRLHSMTVKKSFLSSRKYRQYPPYHASEYNSGLINKNADESSNNSSYTANEENVYGDEQQPMYFQPQFMYPCFITPTLLVPPYHPSQWYEDPRLPYDPQNFICLTQPLAPPPPASSTSSYVPTSSVNSCSSPETGSEVGYSSSSPPTNTRVPENGEAPLSPEEESSDVGYGDANATDINGYTYPNQTFFHQVAGTLPEDQPPPTSPPCFYPGTTYVLKPLAVVRRPPQDSIWEYGGYGGGGGGGLGRRRRRRHFIGGEGITYDRWPSRIAKEPYRTEENYQTHIMQEDAGSQQVAEFSHSTPESCQDNHTEESSHNHEEHVNFVAPTDEEKVLPKEEVDRLSNICLNSEADASPSDAGLSHEVENEIIKEADVCARPGSADLQPAASVSSSQSVILTDALSSACQDPLRYSKYYQICGVDDVEIGEEEYQQEAIEKKEEDESKDDENVETKEEEVVKDEDNVESKDVEEINEEVPEDVEVPESREVIVSAFQRNVKDEIIVHEVGDGSSDVSECGSEDVEMLGHRYQSGADKLYKANNLSLAAELLDSNQQLPYEQHLKPLMERSKRVTLTTTSGYLSNTRHVMENYCSHLTAVKPGLQCNKTTNYLDESEVDDVDVPDVAEEEIVYRQNDANQSRSTKGISPFVFLRSKGPWHGCCCSIM